MEGSPPSPFRDVIGMIVPIGLDQSLAWLTSCLKRHDHAGTEVGTRMSIGSTIRERRRELGLVQAEIADLSGVSERFVREVEADKPTVRLDKLTALANALGLELTLSERR